MAVGSLLLGLYDAAGALQHVGVCASFTMAKRRELVEFLEPYREDALEGHPWAGWAEADGERRMPGGQSRWSQGKDLSWEPLRAELVVEVAYEHMQGRRFRHMAQFRRWRVDKAAGIVRMRSLRWCPAGVDGDFSMVVDVLTSGESAKAKPCHVKVGSQWGVLRCRMKHGQHEQQATNGNSNGKADL